MFTTDLQATTIALDFRVMALEENGGSDGNSSVAELETRVETLEGTAADHEMRISAAEAAINGKSHVLILFLVFLFLWIAVPVFWVSSCILVVFTLWLNVLI